MAYRRKQNATQVADAAIKRAANALNKAGMASEANRLLNKLPANTKR